MEDTVMQRPRGQRGQVRISPQAVYDALWAAGGSGGLASLALILGLVLSEMDRWRVLGRERWGLLYNV